MNGTDAVGQDSSPWTSSPHYSLSMRSRNLFFNGCPPPPLNLSLLWELINIQREARWADRDPPNQRGEDIEATSHVPGLWKKVVELFYQSKKLTERDKLWLWTIKVEILVPFEVMDGALRILSYSKFWLKMQARSWILWLSCFCTLAELSHRCECYDISPADTRVNKGSKSRVKEHVRHGHHHAPHKIKPPRRKGETTNSQDLSDVSLRRPLTLKTTFATGQHINDK